MSDIMPSTRIRDLRYLLGALILGFVFFILVNYLSLFGIVTLNSDFLCIFGIAFTGANLAFTFYTCSNVPELCDDPQQV